MGATVALRGEGGPEREQPCAEWWLPLSVESHPPPRGVAGGPALRIEATSRHRALAHTELSGSRLKALSHTHAASTHPVSVA